MWLDIATAFFAGCLLGGMAAMALLTWLLNPTSTTPPSTSPLKPECSPASPCTAKNGATGRPN